MRTFGKNDFKDFDFVRDDQIGNPRHLSLTTVYRQVLLSDRRGN